ncbi:MAG: D-alanyl-D-alanine carboxypeptidase [Clostridia bacterium]|nr:D-alanyl-D-alanine carboxypeptidase [Clostridia bacterium]
MKKFICAILSAVLISMPLTADANAVGEERISLSAESAVLIDADSTNILCSKNHSQKMGMASTTKIMTALVAAENFDIDKTVTVAPEVVGIEGSSIYLCANEKLTMEELLYALLLQSANDAAAAIAYAVAGSIDAFADMMNGKAEEMGLRNTHFTNPHGLYDEEHYTTAYDLAVITAHALRNEDIKQIVSTYKKTIPSSDGENTRLLVNHNKMLKLYDGAIGVKTGFTKATGRCLVSAAARDGLTLIAVTLNAPDDWNDHTKMLDFGFGNYESLLIADVGSFAYALPVVGGEEDFVTLTNTGELRMTVPKIRGNISCKIEAVHRFEIAPTYRGTDAGRVTYSYEGFSCSSPLISAESIGCAKDTESFWDKLTSFFD